MNSNQIWATGATEHHQLIDAFTIGNDPTLDAVLLPYDVQASKAHAKALLKKGVFTKSQFGKITQILDDAAEAAKQPGFAIPFEMEDCHTYLEHCLTSADPFLGQNIHAGRSRNDQILVTMRLFMREKTAEIKAQLSALIAVLEQKSEQHTNAPMPGFTHMQAAMPTTVGTWFGGFAEVLQQQMIIIEAQQQLLQSNPLGSASGFGINNFNIPREITTKELGFDRQMQNPIACGLTRGLYEAQALSALSGIVLTLGRFANDILFFTTNDKRYFSLPEFLTTGSSIMPQKRNVDAAEIMRGKVSVFFAKEQEVKMLQHGLLSGYNRDISLAKQPVIEGFTLARQMIEVAELFAQNLQPNLAQLKTAMDADLFATEEVYNEMNQGMNFREAYRAVKKRLLPNE
jgi:argininosuccinate lyase